MRASRKIESIREHHRVNIEAIKSLLRSSYTSVLEEQFQLEVFQSQCDIAVLGNSNWYKNRRVSLNGFFQRGESLLLQSGILVVLPEMKQA